MCINVRSSVHQKSRIYFFQGFTKRRVVFRRGSTNSSMVTCTAFVVVGVAVLVGAWFRYGGLESSAIVTDTIQGEYDYIIVGAGTAGSVLAARLAEDANTSVLLLEAGGHYDESPLFHIPMLWPALQRTEYDWEYYTEEQTDILKGTRTRRGYIPRGRVLGGTGMTNVMQHTRGSPFDFDEWSDKDCTGWDYKNVLPYFLKSEDIQIEDLKSSPYHHQGGPIAVSYNPSSGLNDVYFNGARELGYDVTDYNGESQDGFNIVQVSVRNGVRSSTGLEYLGHRSLRPNLDIAIRSFVTKVEIENDEATGVFYIRNGRKRFVRARKEVIISAGAINSPQLLMLSGVGPKPNLEEFKIPVKKDLPVGQNLKDHQLLLLPSRINVSRGLTGNDIQRSLNMPLYNLFKTGPFSTTAVDSSAFLHEDKSKAGKSYPDIQMMFISMLFSVNIGGFDGETLKTVIEEEPSQHGFTVSLCATHPKSSGSIKLRSDDPFDHPVIDPGYFNNKDDIRTTIAGIRIWEKLIETRAFREIGVDINQFKTSLCSEHDFRSDAYWECYIRHVSLTENHFTSTCKMGSGSDPTAVVDPELRVRGIKRLRVADASVFPDMISGNPNAPTIMIAEKAADMIRGIDSVKNFREQMPVK